MKDLKIKYSKFPSLLLIILYSLLITFTQSCRTIRHTLKEPIKDKGTDYLFENLRKNEVHYNYLSAKFTATIDFNGKKNSFSGILRIRHDSAIWISVTPALGIEAARLLITNDSVKMINRFNKTFVSNDYDYINNLINAGFDFDMVESLLIGNDFAYYDIDKFKAKIDNREYRLTTVNRQRIKRYVRKRPQSTDHSQQKILLQDIWLNPETFKITSTDINEIKANRKLHVRYSVFKAITNQIFPEMIEFVLNDKSPIEFTVKYSKIVFDEKLGFPFRIPKDYKKMQ